MQAYLQDFANLEGIEERRQKTPRRSSRRWRTLDTIACEQIARRRAQRLLDDGAIVAAVPWLRYANSMMVRNNVSRLVRLHGAI